MCLQAKSEGAQGSRCPGALLPYHGPTRSHPLSVILERAAARVSLTARWKASLAVTSRYVASPVVDHAGAWRGQGVPDGTVEADADDVARHRRAEEEKDSAEGEGGGGQTDRGVPCTFGRLSVIECKRW